MPSSTVYRGLNIRWGSMGTDKVTLSGGGSAFGASAIITSNDASGTIENVEVKNQYGWTVAWVGFDAKKTATFDYIAADSTTPAVGTATVTHPYQGDVVVVASSADALLDGSFWIVTGVSIKQTNTDVTKVTINAISYPNVTS